MTKEYTPEEIKYRLSDLGVQIGNIAINYITELEKKNAELKKKLKEELKTIADKDLSFVARFDVLEKENAELKSVERMAIYSKMSDRLAKAKEIILKLYNAGRDVLMCRAEEKVYDNLDEAISDKSIAQFLKEVEE